MPMGGELGTKTGQYWAYQKAPTDPPQRALILSPGQHYNADVRIRLMDDPAVTELWINRQELVCLWASVEIYLLDHPEIPQTYGPIPAQTPPPEGATLAFNANELRAIIHNEVTNALGVKKIALHLPRGRDRDRVEHDRASHRSPRVPSRSSLLRVQGAVR